MSSEAIADAFQNDVARVEIRTPLSIIIYERKTRKKWEKIRYDRFGDLRERNNGISGTEVCDDLIGCMIVFNKVPYITGPQGNKTAQIDQTPVLSWQTTK